MKKSILIGVLAALMLLAFTACEQSPSKPLYGADIDNITVSSQPSYIAYFDVVDPAEIKLSVNFNDGTSDEYTGKELALKVSGVLQAEKNIVSGTYNGKSFDVIVTAAMPTGFEYDLSTVEPMNISASKDYSATISATVSSSVGTKTETVPFEIDSTKAASIIDDNSLKAGSKYTLTAEDAETLFESDNASAPCDVTYTGSVELTVVDSTTVAYIVVEQGAKIFGVPELSDTATVKNELSEADLKISTYAADGTLLEDISTDTTNWDITYIGYTADYAFPEAGEYEILVKATGKTGDYKDKTFSTADHPFTLVVSEDYPTAFDVAQPNLQTDENKKDYSKIYWELAEIVADEFDFTAKTWASGYNEYATAADGADTDKLKAPEWTMNFAPDLDRVPVGTASKDNGTDKFNVVFHAEDATIADVSCDVVVYSTEAKAAEAQEVLAKADKT